MSDELIIHFRRHYFPGYSPGMESQRKAVLRAFREPKTMLQVSFETGILRANITRFVSEFQRDGRIIRIKNGICPISKHPAGLYQRIEL
jgi:hypothetical protein